MKKKIFSLPRLLVLAICCFIILPVKNSSAQPGATVTLQVFYDELSPFGQWIQDAQYGYVWVPDVADDFRPYWNDGYWVMTPFGNTWVSEYPWGWAAFHYGRWMYNTYYGWVWIPGYVWGPAWVCWRHGGGYYGWAPLGPWFSFGIAFDTYVCPSNWWVFIPHGNLYHHHHHQTYGPRGKDFFAQTATINNVYTNTENHAVFVTGPKEDEVRQATGENVTVYNIADDPTPGPAAIKDNAVHIYRPVVSVNDAQQPNPAPAHVTGTSRPVGEPQPVEIRRPVFRDEPDDRQPVRQTPEVRPVREAPVPVRTPANPPRPRNDAPQVRPVQQQPIRQNPPAQERPQQPMRR